MSDFKQMVDAYIERKARKTATVISKTYVRGEFVGESEPFIDQDTFGDYSTGANSLAPLLVEAMEALKRLRNPQTGDWRKAIADNAIAHIEKEIGQ